MESPERKYEITDLDQIEALHKRFLEHMDAPALSSPDTEPTIEQRAGLQEIWTEMRDQCVEVAAYYAGLASEWQNRVEQLDLQLRSL